jgi:hypothetical protein
MNLDFERFVTRESERERELEIRAGGLLLALLHFVSASILIPHYFAVTQELANAMKWYRLGVEGAEWLRYIAKKPVRHIRHTTQRIPSSCARARCLPVFPHN